MNLLNAHNVECDSLKACFRTASKAETQKLAELFTPVAIAISKQQKLRVGFRGAGDAGKTSFIKAILSRVFDKEDHIESVHKEFSNVYQNVNVGTWWHYDNYGYYHSHDDYYRFAEHASVHLVEWSDHHNERNPLFDCLWNFSYEGSREQAKFTTEREIDLYATDEIAALPEFQQFLEDAAEFCIS